MIDETSSFMIEALNVLKCVCVCVCVCVCACVFLPAEWGDFNACFGDRNPY